MVEPTLWLNHMKRHSFVGFRMIQHEGIRVCDCGVGAVLFTSEWQGSYLTDQGRYNHVGKSILR